MSWAQVHTIAVDGPETITAGPEHCQVSATPPIDNWNDLARLVARVDATFQRSGVNDGTLIIGPDTMRELGLPDKPPHRRLAPVSFQGYATRVLRACMIWTQPRTAAADGRPVEDRRVNVWLRGWTRDPLLAGPDGLYATVRLWRYRELTGGPYVATPGVSAMIQLRDIYAPRRTPMWRPDWQAVPRQAEHAWQLWEAPSTPAQSSRLAAFDANAAYLAAALVSEVAPDALKHTGKIDFDPRLSGYWQVRRPLTTGGRPAAWAEKRLPDPIGPNMTEEPEPLVSTPTLALLRQLAADGHYPPVEITDSWTARGSRQVLRPWAETLRAARSRVMLSADPDDNPVLAAIKGTYTQGIGMLAAEGSRINRPDWHDHIIGMARANLFRKLWAASRAGFWPVRIETDKVFYPASYFQDGYAELEMFPEGYSLGQFKVTHSFQEGND